MTGSTMYEAVEPQALWKQLLRAALSDICAEEDRIEVLYLTVVALRLTESISSGRTDGIVHSGSIPCT